MIACGLLKWFKLFYISTAMFSSNSTLWTNPQHKPVAITHEVNHPNINMHYEFVILRDQNYRDCFLDHADGHVILSTPKLGLEVWKEPLTRKVIRPVQRMSPTPADEE